MPTAPSASKKTSVSRARKPAVYAGSSVAAQPAPYMPAVPSVCRSCHALPSGSMEMIALMLVLVFSLTAVLFTSVYALKMQEAKIAVLETALGATIH